MPTLSANLTTAKNTLLGGGAWIWLFEIRRDTTNISYYAAQREDVVFDSQTYTAKAIDIKPPQEDAQGTTARFTVTIENVDRVEIAYLMDGKYLDKEINVKLVNLDYVSNALDVVEYYTGVILQATANDQEVTFDCGPYDLRKAPMPGRRLSRTRCDHEIFKDEDCAYAGAETECDRSPATCLNTMANYARFGGCPDIPITAKQ